MSPEQLSEPHPQTQTAARPVRDGQSVALIHDRLRAAILSGELAAGQVAPQAGLAKQLGVGRTPLREALRMLEREGLVLSEPNRRLRIAEFSLADAEEIYVMRIALECWAAQVTVPLLKTADIAELEGLLAQIDFFVRSKNPDGSWPAHSNFHRALVKGAGPRVTHTVAQLLDHAERYWRAVDARVPEERDEHRSILDRAATGDAPGTARLLLNHYVSAANVILHALDPIYVPQRLRSMVEMIDASIAGDG